MKRLVPLVLLMIIGAVVVLGWRHLLPGPEGQIRKRLDRLQELVSFSESEGNLAMLANVQELGSLFAEDVVIRLDAPGELQGTLRGRDSIMQTAVGARRAVGGLRVEFLDVTVNVEGGSAVVEATGKAVLKSSNELWIQELRFNFINTEEGWLIEVVQTVRTLTLNSVQPTELFPMPRAA